MVCLGLKPGAAGWKAHANPLSFAGTPEYNRVPNSKCYKQILAYWLHCTEIKHSDWMFQVM